PVRLGQVEQFPSLQLHAAADARGTGQKTHQRAAGDGLARPAFTDDAEDFSRLHVERYPFHGGDCPEGDVETLDPQQGLLPCLRALEVTSRRCSCPRPSSRKAKPTPSDTSARPGKRHIHHACCTKAGPSAIMTPHSALGGWAPMPRKPK